MKKPKLKRDWVGRKVKALRPLSTGRLAVPEGKILTVTRNWKGLTLVTDGCSNCGVRIFITRVSEHDVELLPIIEHPAGVPLTVAERRNLFNLGPRC
jgi:hypothetical protein